MPLKDMVRTKIYRLFSEWADKNTKLINVDFEEEEMENDLTDDELKDEDDDIIGTLSNRTSNLFKPRYSYKKDYSKGYLEKLNKSDTLVIHCADRTTDMLSQIYNNKGWDVLRDGNIDPEELHQLIQSHDKIIMLGHGTPGGLINIQGGGYVINNEYTEDLKDKNMFVIWCNADKFFRNNNIGFGNFITKNVPSEVWEARAIGYNVSSEWMLENITYWSKCCADVVDIALGGNPEEAVRIARKNYQDRYGNIGTPDEIGVTNYNTDAIQVLK